MFLLFSTAAALNPVIFIPGLTGVKINVSVTKPELYEMCPESLQKPTNLYPLDSSIKEQYADCAGWLYRIQYDNETGKLYHPDGIKMELPEFGSIDTMATYEKFAEYLSTKGYELGKNMFGAPYDWMLYLAGLKDTFMPQLKELIEKAVKDNNEKAVLIGHSMGTHVIRYLTTHHVTQEWINKHIYKTVLLAPAFLGCFGCFNQLYTGALGGWETTSAVQRKSVRQMPSLHILMDNYVAFEEKRTFTGLSQYPDGISPSQTAKYLHEIGVFDDEALEIFKLSEADLSETPREVPVSSLIVYNSAVGTADHYEGDDRKLVYASGDNTCQIGGPAYACSHWNSVKCIDKNSTQAEWGHGQLPRQTELHELVWEFMNEPEPESKTDAQQWLITGAIVCVIVLLSLILAVVLIVTKKESKEDPNEFHSLVDHQPK